MPSEDTQFKPGQSGNLTGRPRGGISLVSILKRKLEEMGEEGNKTLAEELMDKYIAEAMEKGDGQAIRDMMDRTDGKPTNRHEIESDVVIHFDAEDEAL